ncbi:hypothetical protein M441DRAFT_459236, partial [Trichoderma asperellum CBS 433.97]
MAEQAKRAVEGHRRSCATTVPLETCASGLTAGHGASHGRCGAAFSGHLARCSCWFAALRSVIGSGKTAPRILLQPAAGRVWLVRWRSTTARKNISLLTSRPPIACLSSAGQRHKLEAYGHFLRLQQATNPSVAPNSKALGKRVRLQGHQSAATTVMRRRLRSASKAAMAPCCSQKTSYYWEPAVLHAVLFVELTAVCAHLTQRH